MNNKTFLRASSALIALGCGALLPAVAMAQQAASAQADKSNLETIVVTAQKRAENVQDAPLAITAVTGATLEKSRVTSITDLAQSMTGISFTQNSPQANEINIRGVVNTRLTGPTADQSVSTFVDDVYVARSGILNTAFYDVARIEVVRGPQGVLLGKNVAGGAVNVISNKPTQDSSGSVTAAIGNYDLRQINGYVNGALTDSLSGRISFQSIDHAGYAKDLLHNVDLENLNSIQGRVQLAYEPTDSDFKALFIADYSRERNDGVNRVGIVSPTSPAGPTIWSGTRSLISAALGRPLGPRESFPVWPQFKGDIAPSPQLATRENYSFILKMEKGIGENATLSSITGYRRNTAYTLYDHRPWPQLHRPARCWPGCGFQSNPGPIGKRWIEPVVCRAGELPREGQLSHSRISYCLKHGQRQQAELDFRRLLPAEQCPSAQPLLGGIAGSANAQRGISLGRSRA